jgi:hypothetical protein
MAMATFPFNLDFHHERYTQYESRNGSSTGFSCHCIFAHYRTHSFGLQLTIEHFKRRLCPAAGNEAANRRLAVERIGKDAAVLKTMSKRRVLGCMQAMVDIMRETRAGKKAAICDSAWNRTSQTRLKARCRPMIKGGQGGLRTSPDVISGPRCLRAIGANEVSRDVRLMDAIFS